MTLLKVWLLLVAMAVAFVLFLAVKIAIREKKINRSREMFAPYKARVKSLTWVAKIEYPGLRDKVTIGDKEIWADAPLLIILNSPINERHGLVGAIGFYLTKQTLEIRQMQGFKGARFHRGTAKHYFHSCITELAKTLNVKRVYILPAERNYWHKHPYGVSADDVESLRNRLSQLYNEGSKEHGYRRRWNWWYKTI